MVQSADRPESEPAPAEASGGDFVAVMLRRKWIVFLITSVGAGLGYLYYSKAEPVFKSAGQALVIHKDPAMPTRDQLEHDEHGLTTDMLSTAVVVVQSPMILERAARSHNLGALRTFNMPDTFAVAGAIRGGLTITRGGDQMVTENANVVNVSFRGPHPDDCQQVVAAVLDAYESFLNESSQNVGEETLQLIENASEGIHKQLRDKEMEYREWRKISPLLFFGNENGKSVHSSRLAVIEGERSKVRLRTAEVRAHVQTLEEAIKDNVVLEALRLLVERSGVRGPDNNRNTTTSIVEQQLFPLMVEEQLLIESFGPDHPKVKVVRKQIQVLQDLVMGGRGRQQDTASTPAQFMQVYLDSLKQELKELEQHDRQLADDFELEREAAKEAMNYELHDEQFRSEINRLRILFEAVAGRLREMAFVKDYGGLKMRVISKPTISNQKVEPVLVRSVAIGAVLGMMLGIGLAYLIDLADKSFRTPDEIRGQLRLPVIGHIPVIDPATVRRRDRKIAANSKIDEILACYHRPRSTVAEAYRSVRTALYFGTRGEEQKVLQITSADAGDGKTTLAANLAISFAQSGKRICLVDADFRRARMHTLFSVDNSVGISSVMAGQAELPDAIHATEVENLWLLPCGPRPSNPSELLTSHRFKELLDVLRGKFDMILIDTPPLLAVTDPCAVAPRVDSVLLVMRITKNVRPNAMRAKEVLDGLGAKVIGVVVNGVEMRRGYGHDSGYRRYGAGGYGYRDYDYGDYYDDDDVRSSRNSKAKATAATPPPQASA
ncbi:MAG TPA: polysaccharide biosynthesis tyrosine autokinase [Pirellulales bacterium]|jgi:capsular exopolysaccharide synthesis family protein|nr:polysaccharide biosynthesis tyrosine autokinase [Pirellulales bacterium]